MPFIMPDGGSDVTSVNDQKGQVILDYRDVGAVANILDSCGGIQVGTTNQRPSSTKDNVLFIVTDTEPNRFYRYSTELGSWELIGGAGGEGGAPVDVIAIDVKFNNTDTVINSTDVQSVILELNDLIERQGLDLTELVEKNKGKVKLNKLDTATYLDSKIDDITLQIEDNVLVVKGLDGLEASVSELNYLKNAKSNIQGQIDSLSSVGNFTEAVDTHASLTSILNPANNDMAIVIQDETRDEQSTIYMYDGSKWVFVGEFKAEVRNFATDPIRLKEEITGILSETNIDDKIARKSDLIKLMKTTDEVEEGTENFYYTEDRVSNNTDVKNNTLARHTHSNKETIDKLSENVDGKLLFNGNLIEGTGGDGSIDWKEF